MGAERSANENFQVDLGGMVDLLSRHLYSSPRVYLRELVQNAVDAITARAEVEPGCPRRIEVTPADVAPDRRLHIIDTGIGLDAAGISDVLATIGRSSKRDDLGVARAGFIGQFGIGLLSCFLVTDDIEMHTRIVGGSETLCWHGHADGTFAVTPSQTPLPAPGTRVALAPSPATAELLGEDAVRRLLDTFAAYLPCEIVLHGAAGPEQVGGEVFPWSDPTLVGAARRVADIELCERLLGFTPLAVIDLADPETGVHGLAFVTPEVLGRASHRVYVQQMLLAESDENVLPDWAFFVRAVVDATGLHPTASREALFDDDALAGARTRLGEALRSWLSRTAATDPETLREFLRVHHLAAKAMATHDDDMLELVARLLPFESTVGDITLVELRRGGTMLRHASSLPDFRQIAPMATAQGLTVLNAGYAYDLAIVTRFAERHPAVEAQLMRPTDLMAHLEVPDLEDERRFAPLLEAAGRVLTRAGCVPEVRAFLPSHLHVMLLTDRDARHERERQIAEADSDAIWSALLGSVARREHRPSFVLNSRSLTLRRLAGSADPLLQEAAVEALYAHALVAGHHRLRPVDSAITARALPVLIDKLLDLEPPGETDGHHS